MRKERTRSAPQPGDLLLRNASDGTFVVLDALTERHIVGPLPTLQTAIHAAREHGGTSLWHQSVDDRGRALGPAMRLPLRAEK